MGGAPEVEVDVVDLLVAVERLVAAHRDELDTLNVFPVPDGDTGHNVVATVRAARVAAARAPAGTARDAAIEGALRGARGNAGVLTSQLLRGLLEVDGGGWDERLARADDLARAAVAHPVEGSFLTAVRAAAGAAGHHTDPDEQLHAAVRAAHTAVRDSPTMLEVLARAGVVDAGARAAALVLEAVAAVMGGTDPAPPPVHVPEGGPHIAGCELSPEQFEVMYLLDPEGRDVADVLRADLDAVGASVVVVAADRLVSVHVHTDDVDAALEAGSAHGHPHHVRVEDLHEGARRAAAARGVDRGEPGGATGLVVGADGVGIAHLAAAAGAITVALTPAAPPTGEELRAAVTRTGWPHVVLLPASPALAAVAAELDTGETVLTVVTEVDDAARLVAALAVFDPSAPDVDLLAEVAASVRSGAVAGTGEDWTAAVGQLQHTAGTALAALDDVLDDLDAAGSPDLVSLLLGDDVDADLRDAAAAAVTHRWPDAEVDVIEARLASATLMVGVE